MKRIKMTLIIPTSIVMLIVLVYACSKSFLSQPALAAVSPTVLANKSGVEGLLIGAYSMLDGNGSIASNANGWASSGDDWVFGGVSSDDSYKGSEASDQDDIQLLETWTATSTNSYTDAKWSFLYDAINRCNQTILTMRVATGLLAADTIEISAETRFLRAFYHLEAKKVFGNVPWVDETVTISTPYPTNKNSIWPQIVADFQYAIANLPATQTEAGRINKYGAEAFLAKAYLFQHDYTDALTALNDIIQNGVNSSGTKYALGPSFQSNFNSLQKNGPESVFAAQCSVNDGSAAQGTPNGNYGDALNFPYNGGPGACCGFNNPSEDLANAFKTDPTTGLPLLDGSFQTGLNVSAPTNPYTGTLDPRIDWTVGRQGIPYLDWGPHPGDAWIRDPTDDGNFNPKKAVYPQSEKGTVSDATGTYWASVELTSDNINLCRFADVLLWAAECEAQVGSLVNAENYVNMVRTRAALPATWVYLNNDGSSPPFVATTYTYTQSGTTKPADNYFIQNYPAGAFTSGGQAYALNAIMFERRIELAQEGARFFDLQRWDNGTGSMATILTQYAAVTKAFLPGSYWGEADFVKGKSEIFPIPQDQIDVETLSGVSALTQNPGY